MTHLVGQQLGRYLVQEEIGRGGMARVYRALDTMLKRTVALKVLAPQLAADPEFTQRFEREAVTAANLRHSNIVTIYDVGEHNGLRFIAMEYVRGRTLHAIIEERGALGLGYAIGIIGPVAAALDYAHSQGSVHRDIKPQNIMIDADGRVLLADFGIAQAPESGGGGQRLTRTGIFMGTPEYISPEQASAQRVDGRSDLYSLGIATYEVITGAVPFSGATPQLIVAHAQTPPPPPSSIDPSQPPELDLVLGRILAKRPESRFASGMAFVEGLRVVARKHGIAVASTPQIAELALPRNSSAGQSTVSLGRGQTPFAAPAPILPASRPRPAPLAAPELGNGDPTQVGSLAGAPDGPRPSASRPAVVASPPPRASQPSVSPRVAGDGGSRVRVAPPRTAGGYGGDRDNSPRTWIVGGLLGGLFLVLLFVLWRTVNSGDAPRILVTTSPVATIMPTQVTNTPTMTPSNTPVPSPTTAPTEVPTAERIVATAVPVPPTSPPPPPPSDTPAPPPPPSDTPAPPPPSDTPMPAPPPTITPTVEISPTDTPAPPTATATSPPPVTITPPSPMPTAGTAVVSPSPNATAIASPAPSATPTLTPAPTATFTPTTEPPTAVVIAATTTLTTTLGP